MTPQQTPLHQEHINLKARMVDFAGWSMPVVYDSVQEEHRAVREHVGIFDVSHMGEILVLGPKALDYVQKVTCNDASKLKVGDCQYSAFLNEKATFVDDIIVNRVEENKFLICVNASNAAKDFAWLQEHPMDGVSLENVSQNYALIAVQGPEAIGLAQKVFKQDIAWKTFQGRALTWNKTECWVTRTGYTGEDGVEIYLPPGQAVTLWQEFVSQKAKPCGLGARDTLRLEAALPLYGHEITDQIHPLQSRLEWIVKWTKGDFIGRAALEKIKQERTQGLRPREKVLVGLKMIEAGIAREGSLIFDGEKQIGNVVSGTKTPTVNQSIATAYVDPAYAALESKLEIDIHNKKRHAIVTQLPFYKRISQ